MVCDLRKMTKYDWTPSGSRVLGIGFDWLLFEFGHGPHQWYGQL